MGRNTARLVVIVLVAVTTLVSDVAWADPVPIPTRLPVTMSGTVSADTVVVKRGDHLWKISKRHLDHVYDRDPTSDEISPYWREVIEANRPYLRSGDPDLIYPGELVTLPAVNERQ